MDSRWLFHLVHGEICPQRLDDFPKYTESSWQGQAGPKTSFSPAPLFSTIKGKPLIICSMTWACTPTSFALSFPLKSFTRSEEVEMTNLDFPQKSLCGRSGGRDRQAPSPWLLGQHASQTLRGSLRLAGEELAGAGSHAGTPSL